MQVIVVSDSHGYKEPLEYLWRHHHEADFFVHCGDSELPPVYLDNYCAVKGNNDNIFDYPEHIILDLNEHFRALIIHGHRHIVFRDLSILANYAKSKQCNVCFFGHTHVFHDAIVDGVRMINPGCILRCRDFTPGCYALITIEKDVLACQRIDYQMF
ncbi:MAG: YfcE family phosphodiesterase [Erysipelotrichaceae bacterium]|nr:YfcE family phosphodiesterase [Erysipelotrichaceae bacterium]MDY5252351.1 YfcE family phosphodiesterase [Erysipelotrichaceae bacterium]